VSRAVASRLPDISRLGSFRAVLLIGTLAVLVGYFSIRSPFFFTVSNILNIAGELPEIGLLVVGLTFVIIAGGMDLSVGSVVGLSAAVLALLCHTGLNIWICAFIAVLVGAACGALNGLFVAGFKMQAVVVTVGTLVLFRGAIYVLTNGRPQSGFPEEFAFLGQGTVFGLPFNFLLLLAVAISAHFILTRTVYGRRIFALGNNEEALRYSGAPITATRFTTFLVSGVLAAGAGVLLASRLASTQANTGQGFELEAITAVLMGGVYIFGGRGTITGAFLGLLIIVVLRNGLNVIGVSSVIETLILGILILVAVGAGR
jgi:ribose/xylose/arabinose/galactoside ABC-type transport system permease subunit